MGTVREKKEILLIGDIMLDKFFWGITERISPEAPVPIVALNKKTSSLGGCGNVAANLHALNANFCLFSVIGKDESGKEIKALLKKSEIKKYFLFEEERNTSEKTRVFSNNQQVLRFDNDPKEKISKKTEKKLLSSISQYLKVNVVDSIIISDYNKGVLTDTLIKNIIKLTLNKNISIICDPKGKDFIKYKGVKALTPNKTEASLATGIDIVDESSLKKAGKKIINQCKLDFLIITLSEKGLALFIKDKLITLPVQSKEVYDVSGAGDTVLASLTYFMSKDLELKEACYLANVAAGIVVGKVGTAVASKKEIEEYRTDNKKERNKIVSIEELQKIVHKSKKENTKISFTNGCFDILHAGHVRYLEESSKFGDILVLGLNSDNSVKKLKGNSRPINNEKDRSLILSALSFVDFICIFNEETPLKLIKSLKPDFLIKGADYQKKDIVGGDFVESYGGKVIRVGFFDGRSSTDIIKKLQSE